MRNTAIANEPRKSAIMHSDIILLLVVYLTLIPPLLQ